MVTKYVFAAPDSSDADRAAASAGCLFSGSWTTAQKAIISSNTASEIEFRAGTYAFSGALTVGNNTNFHGPAGSIPVPARKRTLVDHDPRTMAVFRSLPSHQYSTETMIGGAPGGVESPTKPSSVKATITTASAGSNVQIADVYMLGYITLNLPSARSCTVFRVVISNYLGKASDYPNGSWCNMGFEATGAFWLKSSCSNIKFDTCISQFSSHHGFNIQFGSGTSTGITLKDCRALHSGCGMIRSGADKRTALALLNESLAVPALKFRQGRGYLCWAVGFDLNEHGTVDDLLAEDCYAYDSWKVGFYQEPGRINKNVRLVRCVSEEAGKRATITIGTGTGAVVRMIPRESEASNFYLQNAVLYDCISRGALKAGYDLFPQSDYTQVVDGVAYRMALVGCKDCGSGYGVACGPCNTGRVLIKNCTFANYGHYAVNLAGNGPYTVKGIRIKVPAERAGRPPLRIGRYCRVNSAMSLSDGRMGNFTSGFKECRDVAVTVDGVVEGLNAGVAAYLGGPYQPKSPGAVTLSRATTPVFSQAELDALCVAATPTDPGDPVEPTDPGDPVEPTDPEVPGEPGTAPVAAFTGAPTSGLAPLTVQFTDQTDGAESWTWSFGDGKTSTIQNPTHTYTVPGTYPVSLNVGKGGMYDGEHKSGYIRVFSAGGTDVVPVNPGNRVWLLSDPKVVQAYDGEGAIAATITLRIDEGQAP
mgnify:CR=1 FL=1